MKGTLNMIRSQSRIKSFIALSMAMMMAFAAVFTFGAQDAKAYSNSKKTKKRAKKVYNYLVKEKGFTKKGAICAVANFDVEASINPKAGHTYYGIAQWGGSRKRKLKKHKKYWTLDVQLKFFHNEMKKSYKKSYKKLKNAKTIKAGTNALIRYEGCSRSTYGRRVKRAKYWQKYLTGKASGSGEKTETKYPTLKIGSKGKYVKIVQKKVKVAVDGKYGKKTAKAVKKFQKKHGIKADGIVGKATWKAMGYK